MREKDITRRLRVLRAAKNFSQERLQRRARISSLNRYWRIEAGEAEPTEKERARLAAALDVAEPELFPPPGEDVPLAAVVEEALSR